MSVMEASLKVDIYANVYPLPSKGWACFEIQVV